LAGASSGLAIALAGTAAGLDATVRHYPFWSSAPMVAVYVTSALAGACLLVAQTSKDSSTDAPLQPVDSTPAVETGQNRVAQNPGAHAENGRANASTSRPEREPSAGGHQNLEIIVYGDRVVGRGFLEGNGLQLHIDNMHQRGIPAGVVIADLDNLTQINRRCGEHIGDLVLSTCLNRLQRLPTATVVGRAGDDTFFAICNALSSESMRPLGKVGQKYVAAVSNYPWWTIEKDLRVTCSVGYALVRPNESGADAAARAVEGFKEAKRRGGNRASAGPRFRSRMDEGSRRLNFS